MIKLIKSIKNRPINIILMVIVWVAYFVNNKFLKIYTNGNVRLFFICYFNDLICPLFFFSYANMLLNTVDKEINRLWVICLVSLCTSCVWEFVAPFIKPSSTTDPLDIVCYMTGGIMYWAILCCVEIRKKSTGVICNVEG